MLHTISIEEFIQKAASLPVLDVRAPKEYEVGHIPQAHSFPIFDDTQRAVIGTAYKQQGHDPAVLIGLDLFGPEYSDLLPDKLHPNAEGYKQLGRNFLDKAAPVLFGAK